VPPKGGLFEAAYVRDMNMVAILPARGVDLPSVVTPRDMEGWPLIVMPAHSNLAHLARDWLQTGGVEVRPAMEIDNIGVIKQLVAAGLGVALVPEVALTQDDPAGGPAARPLDPPLALRLGLIQRRNAPDDPALRIVRDAIMTLARPDTPGAQRVSIGH